jgi:hypothetical protein
MCFAQQRAAAEFGIHAAAFLVNIPLFLANDISWANPTQPPHHAVCLPSIPKIGESLDSLFFGR